VSKLPAGISSNTPLGLLTVLDLGLTGTGPGRTAAGLLAMLGAVVIRPDTALAGAPEAPRTGPEIACDLGKIAVAADLDEPAGRAAAARLAARCDIVIDDSDARAERSGLTYHDLAPGHPGLIYLRITGFGPGSPYAGVDPAEAVIQSLSGLASITGEPAGPPQKVGPDAAVQATALYGCIGVLAAVLQRARTGLGQLVEVTMQEAAINLARTHYSRTAENGRFEERPGNRQPAAQAEPTGAFPAAGTDPNDWVFAHASAEHFWRRLLDVIGRTDALEDPRFADGPTRLAHREATHELIDAWTSQHGKWEILHTWGPAGIAVGAAMTARDLLADPFLRQAGVVAEIDQPGRGPLLVPGLPFTIDGQPCPVRPAPASAQDVAEVLARLPEPGPAVTALPATLTGEPALAGIRILDFTQALSGPTATQALALLGADVIRVERPNPVSLGIERPWFRLNQLSMNKRSVCVDMKTEAGRDVVRRLIPLADVVMENFAPGTIERLGFGWDQVRALNPGAVFGRIKGFPPGSEYSDFISFENIGEAMGGGCSLTGDADGPPMLPGPHMADIGSGLACALGVLALLCARLHTGRGAEVTASMQGTVAAIFARIPLARQLDHDDSLSRNGFGEIGDQVAPSAAYRCAGDGMNDYCYIRAETGPQWQALVAAMDRAGLAADQRFATAAARWAHRAALDEAIGAWTRPLGKHEVMARLSAAGVPAAAVLDTAELMNDPYLRRRDVFVEIPHPAGGRVHHVFWPVRMARSRVDLAPAPERGQHNEQILGTMLGLSAGELAAVAPGDASQRERTGQPS
jgi:formyl-CoA transferase